MSTAISTTSLPAAPTMSAASAPAAGRVLTHFIPTRTLEPAHCGARSLVLHPEHQTSHLIQHVGGLLGTPLDRPGNRERFSRAVEAITVADNPHILRCDEHGWDEHGPYVVCDYTGDADGVVTLERLLTLKGGVLTLEESKRALEQLMSACAAAHAAGVHHGRITLHDIQVDRRGSLLIGLYGLRQQLNPEFTAPADEVASIAEIGYRLVTGLLPLRPLIPVEHMIRRIDPSWSDYFQTALENPGFSTSPHALAAVQGLVLEGSIGNSLRDLIRSLLTPQR